jgi:NAD(P)-dependent dehydrogenase (short-subunit alcohol dehydrogenase family)
LAAAKLFVREGAYVFITGRRQKELDAAVKTIGSHVTGIHCGLDVSQDTREVLPYHGSGETRSREQAPTAQTTVGVPTKSPTVNGSPEQIIL